MVVGRGSRSTSTGCWSPDAATQVVPGWSSTTAPGRTRGSVDSVDEALTCIGAPRSSSASSSGPPRSRTVAETV